MTTDNWTSNGVGNWTTGSDWSLGAPPTSAEDAFVGTGMGGLVGSSANVTVNSLGVSSAYTLDINSGSVFTLTNGTGSQEVIGSIAILDSATLQIQNNVFENAGTVELELTGDATNITVVGTVSLTGGGSIEFQPGVSGSQNALFGISASAELYNFDNDISGTGIIENVYFTNELSGLIETNNSLGTGFMQIWGTANGGNFFNAGTVRADNGGVLQLGWKPGVASTINNDGLMEVLGTNTNTDLYIQGNVTIDQSSSGEIRLGGSNPNFDLIVSNGIIGAATLTLDGGLIDGAGDIGDSTALQVNIGAGTTIDANNANSFLNLDAGSLAINNAGQIEAVGGKLEINCIVNSANGIVSIGQGGTLYLPSPGSINGNVTFTGGNAMLELINGSQINGEITGAQEGNAIEFLTTTFMAGMQAVWQQNGSTGTLSLVGNGSTLATLTLAGQYTSSDFTAVSADQGNITQINCGNPLPPAGTVSNIIMTDGNGDYSIYDVGASLALANYPLGNFGTVWQLKDVGDFSGSDISDMVFWNSSSGTVELYDVSNNNVTNTAALAIVGSGWQVAGFGDFSTNPNETDMMLFNGNNGIFEAYEISNSSVTGASEIAHVGSGWQVAGFGDFSTNANETDMMLFNPNLGLFEAYGISHGTIVSAAEIAHVGSGWQVAGFGDFSTNANETDMVLFNPNLGLFEAYGISHGTIVSAAEIAHVGSGWQVAGFGDFSSNPNETDMMLYNNNTGTFELYDISHGTVTSAAEIAVVGPGWTPVGFGNFSGHNNEPDMLLRNNNDGALEVYDISHNQVTYAGVFASPGVEWHIVGIAPSVTT